MHGIRRTPSSPLCLFFGKQAMKAPPKSDEAFWKQKAKYIRKVDDLEGFDGKSHVNLDLFYGKVKDEGSRAKLRAFLEKWGEFVTELNLYNNNLGPEGIKELLPGLMRLVNCKQFNLYKNNLDDDAKALVYHAIATSNHRPEEITRLALEGEHAWWFIHSPPLPCC